MLWSFAAMARTAHTERHPQLQYSVVNKQGYKITKTFLKESNRWRTNELDKVNNSTYRLVESAVFCWFRKVFWTRIGLREGNRQSGSSAVCFRRLLNQIHGWGYCLFSWCARSTAVGTFAKAISSVSSRNQAMVRGSEKILSNQVLGHNVRISTNQLGCRQRTKGFRPAGRLVVGLLAAEQLFVAQLRRSWRAVGVSTPATIVSSEARRRVGQRVSWVPSTILHHLIQEVYSCIRRGITR